MVLFYPKKIFQDFGFVRLNVFAGFLLVEIFDFFGSVSTLFLICKVHLTNGLTLVGIVEFAGKLHVHFGVFVYHSFLKKTVDKFAQAEKRTHGHGISNIVQTR